MEEVVEMTLRYVALGDLRKRWRQKETRLHPALLKKLDKFKRIKIEKDKPLHISGSDGGVLVYGQKVDGVKGGRVAKSYKIQRELIADKL